MTLGLVTMSEMVGALFAYSVDQLGNTATVSKNDAFFATMRAILTRALRSTAGGLVPFGGGNIAKGGFNGDPVAMMRGITSMGLSAFTGSGLVGNLAKGGMLGVAAIPIAAAAMSTGALEYAMYDMYSDMHGVRGADDVYRSLPDY